MDLDIQNSSCIKTANLRFSELNIGNFRKTLHITMQVIFQRLLARADIKFSRIHKTNNISRMNTKIHFVKDFSWDNVNIHLHTNNINVRISYREPGSDVSMFHSTKLVQLKYLIKISNKGNNKVSK